MAKKKAAPVFEPVTQQADPDQGPGYGEIGMEMAVEAPEETAQEAETETQAAPAKPAAKAKPAAPKAQAEEVQEEPEAEAAPEEAEGEEPATETESEQAEETDAEPETESEEPAAEAEATEEEAQPETPPLDDQRAQEVAIAREFSEAMSDPDVRLAYYKNIQKRGGQLTAEHQADFDALIDAQVQQPEAKKPAEAAQEQAKPLTMDEARKAARKLMAEGKEDEAVLVLQEATGLTKRLAEIEKAIQADKAKATQAQAQAKAREAQARIQGEIVQMTKDFPHLIEAKGGKLVWKDAKFKEGMAKATDPRSPDYVGPNVNLGRVARLVLAEQGRLGKPQAKPKVAPTKAPIAPAARTSEVRKKPDVGEIAMDMPVE